MNLPCPNVGGQGDGRCAGTGSINVNHNVLTGTVRDTLIEDNIVLGGSESIYCPQKTTINFVVTKNKLSNAWAGHPPQTAGCANEDAGDNEIYETGAHIDLQ